MMTAPESNGSSNVINAISPNVLPGSTEANWRNVGNWHWIDKNCSPWAHAWLKEHLVSHVQKDISVTLSNEQSRHVDATDAILSCTSLNSVQGEVDVHQRKGRVLCLFELELVLSWQAKKAMDETILAEGTLIVKEYSQDMQNVEDCAIEFKISKGHDATWRSLVRQALVPKLFEALLVFKKVLNEEQGKTVVIPEDQLRTPAKNTKPEIKPVAVEKVEKEKATATPVQNAETVTKRAEKPVSVANGSIDMTVTFNASAQDVYLALTEPARVQAWARGSPLTPPVFQAPFALFDNHVSGNWLELLPAKTLAMTWRISSWPLHIYSTVVLTFKELDGECQVHVKQTGIPGGDEEVARVEQNWTRYYWQPIKVTFGYGAFL